MSSFYSVWQHSKKDLPPEQRALGERLVVYELIKQIIALYLIYVIVYLSLYTNTRYMLNPQPFIPSLICVFLYVHNTINIQVAHVSK